MTIKWSANAQRDIARLRAFVAADDAKTASRIVREIVSRVQTLERFPEIGAKLDDFEPRDVRRLIVGEYEVRYEVTPAVTDVVRVWHVREDR